MRGQSSGAGARKSVGRSAGRSVSSQKLLCTPSAPLMQDMLGEAYPQHLMHQLAQGVQCAIQVGAWTGGQPVLLARHSS